MLASGGRWHSRRCPARHSSCCLVAGCPLCGALTSCVAHDTGGTHDALRLHGSSTWRCFLRPGVSRFGSSFACRVRLSLQGSQECRMGMNRFGSLPSAGLALAACIGAAMQNNKTSAGLFSSGVIVCLAQVGVPLHNRQGTLVCCCMFGNYFSRLYLCTYAK